MKTRFDELIKRVDMSRERSVADGAREYQRMWALTLEQTLVGGHGRVHRWTS